MASVDQFIEMTAGPHLLWVGGGNGVPFFGITVRRIEGADVVEKCGFSRSWNINESDLLRNDWSRALGMTAVEYAAIRTEISGLIATKNVVRG